MTEPVLGSYYSFKMMDGTATAPTQFTGEGMYVGKRGAYTIFATALPKRSAESIKPQTIQFTYTKLAFHPIQAPSDKVMITSETQYLLQAYLRSDRFKDPPDNGRTSPTRILSPEELLFGAYRPQ